MRRDTLRFVLAAIRTEEDARRVAAIDELTAGGLDEPARATWLAEHAPERLDDAAIKDVLKRQVKMRRDSIEAFEKGGRAELAAREKAQLDEAAVEVAVRTAVADTGAVGPKDMGKVIAAVRAALGDTAEGRTVAAVAQRVLKEKAST